jgi:hypothetical protein
MHAQAVNEWPGGALIEIPLSNFQLPASSPIPTQVTTHIIHKTNAIQNVQTPIYHLHPSFGRCF